MHDFDDEMQSDEQFDEADGEYGEDFMDFDDEPADIDDDHGMNPYDGTYDWMENVGEWHDY